MRRAQRVRSAAGVTSELSGTNRFEGGVDWRTTVERVHADAGDGGLGDLVGDVIDRVGRGRLEGAHDELRHGRERAGGGLQLADGTAVWGGGCGGTVPPIRQVDTYWGAAESGPRTFLARVTADARAVVVTLSDGTREDLVLHRVPEHGALRVGVLVYPRVLDVHRVDVLDADGRPLPVEP